MNDNERLVKQYPWLTPTNRWTGKIVEDYDYSWTELDAMPSGWLAAFGEAMCEDINKVLMTWPESARKEFRITQIKEKYGELRFYTNCTTEELGKVIQKYTDLSRKTCIVCGAPATRVTTGWISPYCDNCVSKDENSIPIKEWLEKR